MEKPRNALQKIRTMNDEGSRNIQQIPKEFRGSHKRIK